MVAASILPVTIHNGNLYFLFGKESPNEKSAKGWSDFGGRVEPNETIFNAAVREGSEELTGFLGNKNELRSLIIRNGGTYKLKMQNNAYHIHIFYLPYDENLPTYYNLNHKFIWKMMDNKILSNTTIFEKIEIDWFSLSCMKKRKPEFRNFYQSFIFDFQKNIDNIYRFIEKQHLKYINKNV